MNKISVIIPFGNNESTITRCIESVLEQSYVNFEVLAVSDGATDSSNDIILKFSLMDSRVHLILREHKGVSCARNAGIDCAEGDFIQFIDADDYIEPDMFEKMMRALEESDADICACGFSHPCLVNYAPERIFDFNNKKEILEYYQYTFAGHIPWNKLYRREAITDQFIEGLNFSEDGMFGIANMFNAQKIVCLKEQLYHYYVAPADSENKSCISKIAAEPFWKTKDTYWYKRAALLETSRDIFSKHLPQDDVQDFIYVRIFDFMIWETIIFASTGAEEENVFLNIERIFREPEFIKSITAREKHSVRFKSLNESERTCRIRDFVSLCFDFTQKYPNGTEELRPFYVYVDIFAKLFLEPCGYIEKDTVILIAKALLDLEENTTPEARYTNSVCESMLLSAQYA